MDNKRIIEIVVKNVACMDHDYVYMEQQTSHNGGLDFEVTGQWKQLRDEHSLKAANEWVSMPPVRIPCVEQVPQGCGRIEYPGKIR